eukprot:gene8051-5604_t
MLSFLLFAAFCVRLRSSYFIYYYIYFFLFVEKESELLAAAIAGRTALCCTRYHQRRLSREIPEQKINNYTSGNRNAFEGGTPRPPHNTSTMTTTVNRSDPSRQDAANAILYQASEDLQAHFDAYVRHALDTVTAHTAGLKTDAQQLRLGAVLEAARKYAMDSRDMRDPLVTVKTRHAGDKKPQSCPSNASIEISITAEGDPGRTSGVATAMATLRDDCLDDLCVRAMRLQEMRSHFFSKLHQLANVFMGEQQQQRQRMKMQQQHSRPLTGVGPLHAWRHRMWKTAETTLEYRWPSTPQAEPETVVLDDSEETEAAHLAAQHTSPSPPSAADDLSLPMLVTHYVHSFMREDAETAELTLPLCPRPDTFASFYHLAVREKKWDHAWRQTTRTSSAPIEAETAAREKGAGSQMAVEAAAQVLWHLMLRDIQSEHLAAPPSPPSTGTAGPNPPLSPPPAFGVSSTLLLRIVCFGGGGATTTTTTTPPEGNRTIDSAAAPSSSFAVGTTPCLVLPLFRSLHRVASDDPQLGEIPPSGGDKEEDEEDEELSIRDDTDNIVLKHESRTRAPNTAGSAARAKEPLRPSDVGLSDLARLEQWRAAHAVRLGFAVAPFATLGSYFVLPPSLWHPAREGDDGSRQGALDAAAALLGSAALRPRREVELTRVVMRWMELLWSRLALPTTAAGEAEEEEEEIMKEFLQVLRTRLCVEVVGRVLAYQEAVLRFCEGETSLAIGVPQPTSVLLGPEPPLAEDRASESGQNVPSSRDAAAAAGENPPAPHTMWPAVVLPLPEEEQVFFGAAYAIGAAIDLEAHAVEAGQREEGQKALLRGFLCRDVPRLATPLLGCLRLWLYLWDYVLQISPFPKGATSATTTAAAAAGAAGRVYVERNMALGWVRDVLAPAVAWDACEQAAMIKGNTATPLLLNERSGVSERGCTSTISIISSSWPAPAWCEQSGGIQLARRDATSADSATAPPMPAILRRCRHQLQRRVVRAICRASSVPHLLEE